MPKPSESPIIQMYCKYFEGFGIFKHLCTKHLCLNALKNISMLKYLLIQASLGVLELFVKQQNTTGALSELRSFSSRGKKTSAEM